MDLALLKFYFVVLLLQFIDSFLDKFVRLWLTVVNTQLLSHLLQPFFLGRLLLSVIFLEGVTLAFLLLTNAVHVFEVHAQWRVVRSKLYLSHSGLLQLFYLFQRIEHVAVMPLQSEFFLAL